MMKYSYTQKFMRLYHHVSGSRTYDIVDRFDHRTGGDNYGRENATQTKSRPSVTVNMATLRLIANAIRFQICRYLGDVRCAP
jgi:hypothetical protein